MKGTVSAHKALQGSETETRELLGGTDILPTRQWLHSNKSTPLEILKLFISFFQCSDKPQIAAPGMAGVPVSARTAASETTAVNIAL